MEEEKGYIILTSQNSTKLCELVNEKINEGFTLVGGVSIATYLQHNGDPSLVMSQAIYKKK